MAARVLHLLDVDPDYQTETALAQLTRGDAGCDVRTIGRGGDFATPLLGMLKLRKQAAAYDVIHAWGEPALSIAAIGVASSRRIVYSPTRFPMQRDLRWVRAVMSARDVQIVCPTDTMRRAFVERGVPIERCHLVRPGVDFGRVNRRRNDQLREQLGFSKDDFVMLAAGESIRPANHHATILAAAVLHLLDPKLKLLLWGRGPLAGSEKKYAAQMLPPGFMSVATDRLGNTVRFEQLLPAADAAMITASAPVPTLPIAVCMAAPLPIVAVVSETISELLEDRHTCVMVRGATSRLLARRVIDLREDAHLQWSISDAARTEAYEFFTMTRFVNQMRAVHEQVAEGKPTVEVPQQAPGAGMRFYGRA